VSIKAYVGRTGSGKTYEVVSVVIYEALRSGRRVVSNIAGLNFEVMRDALLSEGVPAEKIGSIVSVDHSAVLDGNFWLSDKPYSEPTAQSSRGFFSRGAEAPPPDQKDFFIQGGDLVVLDEIWRFWSGFSTKDDEGLKRPPTVLNFFRMHRHFLHSVTGVSCDLALITQDVQDINRCVRGIIEETYSMEKLTVIGSSSRYRVDIYRGGSTARKPLRSLQRSYNDKYFPFYSSHSQKVEGGADGVEVNIDGRGNLLKGALFKFVLPIGLIVFLIAVWSVFSFFKGPKKVDTAVVASKSPEIKTPDTPAIKAPSDLSDKWRVVGFVRSALGVSVILAGEGRTRVLFNPPSVKFSAYEVETFLPSGEAVTSWTGSTKEGGIIPGSK
jgi:zona occludens toxin